MPSGMPPKKPSAPNIHVLPAGTLIWRLARTPPAGTTRRAARLFNRPRPAVPPTQRQGDDALWGGRFDPPPQTCSFAYAGLDELTAISEVLLRDQAFDGPRRYLPLCAVEGRSLQMIETLRPLSLVSLVSLSDLAAAYQDTWLIQARPAEFGLTQQWGRWLRPPAGDGDGGLAGLVWPAKRNPGGRAVVLFEDACGRGTLRTAFERPIDRGPGLDWLQRRLGTLQTRVRIPRAT